MQPHTAAQVGISYYLDHLKRLDHLPDGWKSADFEVSDNIYNAKKDINRIKYYKFRCYPDGDRNMIATISGFRDCRATVSSKTEGYYEIQHGCYRAVREEYRILPERVTNGRTLFSDKHGDFTGHAIDEKRLVLSDQRTMSRHTVKIESVRITKHQPVKKNEQSKGETKGETKAETYVSPESEEYSENQPLQQIDDTMQAKWSVQKMLFSMIILVAVIMLFGLLLIFTLMIDFLKG